MHTNGRNLWEMRKDRSIDATFGPLPCEYLIAVAPLIGSTLYYFGLSRIIRAEESRPPGVVISLESILRLGQSWHALIGFPFGARIDAINVYDVDDQNLDVQMTPDFW